MASDFARAHEWCNQTCFNQLFFALPPPCVKADFRGLSAHDLFCLSDSFFPNPDLAAVLANYAVGDRICCPQALAAQIPKYPFW